MSTYSGRNAAVKIGTTLIAELGNYNLTRTRDEVDTTAFGDTWGKTDVAMGKWTATFSGSMDPSDTTGQAALDTAFGAGSLVGELRFYIDNTSYWEAASTTQGGGRLTNVTITHDKAGVATVTFTASGSGEITLN